MEQGKTAWSKTTIENMGSPDYEQLMARNEAKRWRASEDNESTSLHPVKGLLYAR
jgi:hypothetical protein